MLKSFNQLPDLYQGITYITAGTSVLLYALGIIQKGISLLIVGLAFYAIFIGLTKLGILQKTYSLLGHTKKR